MNTKITLTNPTADKLNAAVAEYVAGWRRVPPPHGKKREWSHMLLSPSAKEWGNDYKGQYIVVWKDGDLGGDVPKWATSADAVLPLLEKWAAAATYNGPCINMTPDCQWIVTLHNEDDIVASAFDKSLPRAACIALLRANGVTVDGR